ASIGQMVAGLSRKKKSLAAHAAPLEAALSEFHKVARELTEAIDRDASSYESVLVAHRLPRETVEERQKRDRAIQRAFEAAVEAPIEIARKAVEVFEKLGQLEPMSAPSMVSDVRVGRMMAATAVRGAIENVRVNLESITDAAFAARARTEAESLAARIVENPVATGKI
ncbi:MAG: cyclodeaminase/cyclohydrolase family protein, partial [Candidatus Acidiferrales bacterium]